MVEQKTDGWLNHQLHWARSLAPAIRGTEDEITWMIFPLLFKSPDENSGNNGTTMFVSTITGPLGH